MSDELLKRNAQMLNSLIEHRAQETIKAMVGKLDIPVDILGSTQQFKNRFQNPETTAFIMMRFGKNPEHKLIAETIKRTLAQYGVTALRADDFSFHTDVYQNTLTYMHCCQLGIAVFEQIETQDFNPNIAFEVGYMYALGGRQICLLKDERLRLFADLLGKIHNEFNSYQIAETIPPVLEKWLEGLGYEKR